MHRIWTVLFALAAAFAIGMFVWASGRTALWFPENVSPLGDRIDHLFWVIFGITAATFLVVEALFVGFLWKYGDGAAPGKGAFVHGNAKLEAVWTAVPAGILVFIAVYQYDTWKEAKFASRAPRAPLHARVLAGQFEWRFTYPGADGQLDTPDDLEEVNVLHAVKDQDVVLRLESRDVIHSFFVPQLRLKQDAVPGMTQKVWFRARAAGEYDIACAELCGWGHYKMRGRLVVHGSQFEYEAWFRDAQARHRADLKDPSIWER